MGAFATWAEDMGMGLGQQAASSGLGMILGRMNDKYQDKRQLEQQGKLQAMQEAGQIRVGKAMGDYNLENAKAMWEHTGYVGQKDQIKRAGLNPALLYGMKGGGGITTGPTASAGNVGTDTTTPTSSKPVEAMGMGIQAGLMRAQKENIEAATAKTLAEIENLPKTGANIDADTALKKVNTDIARIQKEVAGATIEEAIMKVTMEASKLQEENTQAGVATQVARGTQQATILAQQAGLATILLNNKQIQAETKMTEEQTKAIGTQLAQGWEKLRQSSKQLTYEEWDKAIKQQLADFQTTHPNVEQIKGNLLDQLIKGFIKIAEK
ncbi:MAG: DNA pilot protein [Microviridae sp.]|nr:MAG: DNA pilot protein [Microviridae sp.]